MAPTGPREARPDDRLRAVPTGDLTIMPAGIEFVEKWWARFALPTLRSLITIR
jgi:hypothetical protein